MEGGGGGGGGVEGVPNHGGHVVDVLAERGGGGRREGGGGPRPRDAGDDSTAWIPVLVEALERGAPYAEVRDLVLQQRRGLLWGGVRVGSWVLQEFLHHARPGRAGRGRRRGRGGYPTLPMIEFLVEEVGWGPEILTMKDSDGYVALHLAIINRAPSSVVKYLVAKAPEAVRVRASDPRENGFFPIHLAVDRPQRFVGRDDPAILDPISDDVDMMPWETVQCLLDAWPESIQQTSNDGWTPLHHAIRHLQRNRSNDRRVGLIHRWPESLQWKTEDGHGPLAFHVAVSTSVPLPDLRYLLNAYPDAIRTRSGASNDGYLPIHHAFVTARGTARHAGISDLPTLQFLVASFPSSLLERTPRGLLPLHLAFSTEDGEIPESAPDLDMVQFMVEQCPESVREAKASREIDWIEYGWIALHYAARNPYTSPDVIRYLVAQHPESVMVPEGVCSRRVPLHVAVESDLSVASIEALVRAGPQALRAWTCKFATFGFLPIHWLLVSGDRECPRQLWRQDRRHGTLLDVVRCLVTHYPSSLRITTLRQGKIPLHLALLEDPEPGSPDETQSDAVVEYLLRQWPESVREFTTDRGWLALHCAAHTGRSVRVLRSLRNLWPNSIHQVTRDVKQLLPIHVAAATPSILEPSFQFLLSLWPSSELEMSGERWLPIHYAAGTDGTPDTIEHLIDLHPASVRHGTNKGYNPIHLAALRPCPGRWLYLADIPLTRRRKLEAIRRLVEHDPDSLLARASQDGALPLHCAIRSDGLDMDVVKYLVEQCPESVHERDYGGSLPIHVALEQVCRERDHLFPVVETLVEAHPESLHEKDARGRLPLHLAAESDHASLDVVYLLLRRRPETILGPGRGRDHDDDDVDVGGGSRRPAAAIDRPRGTTLAAKRLRRSESAP